MISRFGKMAIVLGLLNAVGPFAIDMYLPALPTIAADLHASTAATQMTLTAFFITFGSFQLLYGPWSDSAGRKLPLYFGVGVFILGTIGCGLAPSVGWLIACRAVQGVGAAAVVVIPRAIIRDLHTGHEATRLMSLVMLVFSVSPLLAPLFGSALIAFLDWRLIFLALTIAALLGVALIATVLPETRPPAERIRADPRSILGSFGRLLRDARFLGLVLTGGLGMSSFFVFIAMSSFIYTGHFGLSPTEYSLAFSVNALGFIGSAQFASHWSRRFGMARTVLTAATGFAVFAVLLLVLVSLGLDRLAPIMALLFLAFSCLGLVIPTTMVMALDEHGPIAGSASALGGTVQMVTGGSMVVVASLIFDGTIRPMVMLIATCSVGLLVIGLLTLVRDVRSPAGRPSPSR